MIVSLKWLREYVDFSLSMEELTHRLTMVGLEIEGYHSLYPNLDKVITGRVESVRPHPSADRLKVCRVFDGNRTYSVVCGAPNVRDGAVVALALPGAELPGGMDLGETTIRGELSQGMLCSMKELEMGEDAAGIWVLPPDTPLGIPIDKAARVDDTIIEVSVTPNRGDCLSVIGIAREIAAITGRPLQYPRITLQETGPPVSSLSSVTIEDPDGCPRYAARIVEGIKVGPSPGWLKSRLESVGLRSINNIVDVTNYVLMELGQPLHAFDFDRLRENRIVVRKAFGGERFTTLDGTERELFDDTLLICDGVGPVAIAGIMGGLNSEIESETTRVLIESAYFQPRSIRRTSKKLGLRTESSYRFERGVDPEGVIRAVDRAAQLMFEVGGGSIVRGIIDVYPSPVSMPAIIMRVDRVNRFLGIELKASEMADILRSIEMQVEELDGGLLRVVPPAFRADITREVDLSEEIARLAGYDRIPVTYPKAGLQAASVDLHLKTREEVKFALQGAGFYEVLNYSFISTGALKKLRYTPEDMRLQPVCIMNPLSEELEVMRTTLLPGILNAVRFNLDRRNEDLRIFELSKVFLPRADELLPEEPHHLAGAMTGKRFPQLLYGGEDEVDYTDVKGVVEMILGLLNVEQVLYSGEELPPYLDSACAASLYCSGSHVGALGRLHPGVEESFDFKKPVYVFRLDFEKLYAMRRPRSLFKSLPKFPSVVRDMALIADEDLAVGTLLDFIWKQKEPLIEQVDVFDIYKSRQLGEGKRSIGYRLVYRAPDRSLTDEEVNEMHLRLVNNVLNTFDVSLR